jgi:uncharacterized membrane protein YeiH
MDTALFVLSILGTAVFAASGALVAAEQKFDLVGAVFLSIAAGMGGGTIVDLLIGAEVRWLTSPEPLWAALASAIIVFETVRFGPPPEKSLLWADAVGLALFTATGIQRLIALDLDPAVTIFLTVIGASGGGIVRDVLANRVPLVFSSETELYVTAALLGALCYYAVKLVGLDDAWALAAAIIVTLVIRSVAIVYTLRLRPGDIRRED